MRAPSARPTRLLALVSLVALVLVAACSQGPGPTPEQYASMADSVCKAQDEKMDELQERYDVAVYEAAITGERSANVARPERWMRAEIVPEYKTMAGQLKGMRPPDGDHQYLADLYADLDRLIVDLNSRPSRGRALISEDEELRHRFESYGMEVCGTV